MVDPNRLPPFTDRRRRLPPVFPQVIPLPPALKQLATNLGREHGDDPGDVLADLLALMADEIEGEIFDPRELGFATTPWSDQPAGAPKPEPPAAPEPRGPHPASQAPPAGSAP